MAPPVTQCAVDLTQIAEDVLTAEVGSVLTALQDEYNTRYGWSLALDEPVGYWHGEQIDPAWGSPGVGIYVRRSQVLQADALGAYDVQHSAECTLILPAGAASAIDPSQYEGALQLYAWALGYTLQRHLPSDTYGRTQGIYQCVPVTITPSPLLEDERGLYFRAVTIEWTARQRVRAYV